MFAKTVNRHMVRNKNSVIALCFIVLAICACSSAFGQPTPDGPPPNPGGEPVPITGVEWLLISGGIFGSLKLASRRIFKNDSDRT